MDDKLDRILDNGAAATTVEALAREPFADLCEYVAALERRISDLERREHSHVTDADARKLHLAMYNRQAMGDEDS